MKQILILLLTMITPLVAFAQNKEEPKGLDEKINAAFMPVAEWWEGFVLYRIPLGDTYSIPIVVLLLVIGATFFTIYFKAPAIRNFLLAIRTVRGKYDAMDHHEALTSKNASGLAVEGDVIGTIKDESKHGEVSHFQALATAVSGTVGLGNIAGVAVAISLGGPGATFWMIVCGILGMTTKFVECTLGVKYRDVDKDGTVYGGPMYYLSKGLADRNLKKLGRTLAIVFAILCIGASFGGGNAFQANQAVKQVISIIGIESGFAKTLIGLFLAAIVGIVIIGGIKRIAQLTEKVVPFMAGLYIVASLIIIFAHTSYIDDAFVLILQNAFTPMAGLGGVLGVLIVGFQRAAFSNEAGAGSAAIAHSAVKTRYPASEGVVSLLEPFIDTVVICTMTALVIIFYNMDGANIQHVFTYGNVENSNVFLNESGKYVGGVDLTSLAYESVIPGFSYVLTIAVFLFAFSTMISWSYYGIQAWKFLFGKGRRADLVYKILFLAFVVIGSAATLDAVIKFSDAMILAMVFPNMIGLLLLFPRVKEELNKYLSAINLFKKTQKSGS